MKNEFKLNIVPNKSTTYLLPFVIEQFEFNMYPGLKNTYVSFDGNDELFCIMYKWTADPEFLKFESNMMKNHLYVGHQDYGEYSVYKFRLSRNMLTGRELFLKGEYKNFSDAHKDAISVYLDRRGAKNKERIISMLDKNDSLFSTPPIIENEIVINNVQKVKIQRETFKD